MPMSREQAQALTRTVHLLRPAWSEEGIYAALAKCRERDAIEVALAAIRAAGDKAAKTPGVIPTAGAHWNELDPAAPKMPHVPREERRKRTCSVCGGFDGCKPPAHTFVALDHAKRDVTNDSSAAALARAALLTARANCCSHGVDLRRGVCTDDHETEPEEAASA